MPWRRYLVGCSFSAACSPHIQSQGQNLRRLRDLKLSLLCLALLLPSVLRCSQAVNESGNGAAAAFQVWTSSNNSDAAAAETMTMGAAHLNEDDICWKPKRGTSFRAGGGGGERQSHHMHLRVSHTTWMAAITKNQ